MTTIIEKDYVVEVSDPDMDDTVAHLHLEGSAFALCGVEGRSTKHNQKCGGTWVQSLRATAYCPACGAPVCPFCRLIVEGLPYA